MKCGKLQLLGICFATILPVTLLCSTRTWGKWAAFEINKQNRERLRYETVNFQTKASSVEDTYSQSSITMVHRDL